MTIRPFNHRHPILGEDVYIDESAVVIGDVTLGDDVSISANQCGARRC
jgi:carbonic anhydrase/acetyltransferase-like protein (isoleucine patch superfamily)